MTQTGLETRLLAAETTRKALERRLATLLPAPNWLDAIIGSWCKDIPAFDEVRALGRAFRDAEPSPDVRHAATGPTARLPRARLLSATRSKHDGQSA